MYWRDNNAVTKSVELARFMRSRSPDMDALIFCGSVLLEVGLHNPLAAAIGHPVCPAPF